MDWHRTQSEDHARDMENREGTALFHSQEDTANTLFGYHAVNDHTSVKLHTQSFNMTFLRDNVLNLMQKRKFHAEVLWSSPIRNQQNVQAGCVVCSWKLECQGWNRKEEKLVGTIFWETEMKQENNLSVLVHPIIIANADFEQSKWLLFTWT